jgi:hypothetical protein
MPSLGEFLGALLADAAQARIRADVETIRFAEIYNQDPHLRHLPVPRFRLPEITVDVPLLILDISGTTASPQGLPFEEPSSTELRSVVRAGLRAAGVRVPRAASSKVPGDVINRAREFFGSGSPRLLNPKVVSSDIAGMVVDAVNDAMETELPADQIERLRGGAAAAATALLMTKQRLSLAWQVAVTAAEVKAQEYNDSVVRLRLTLSEDGYEVISQSGDGTAFRLTPE